MNRIRQRLTYANVMATIAVFIVLGGTTYAATGGNFILGQPNTAGQQTSLTASPSFAGKALQLTNTNTGGGATALGLNVASGHSPFTVSSGTKVTNLNADKLDGLDSSAFLPNSKLVRVGPVTVTPPDGELRVVQIATVGHFAFAGGCLRNDADTSADSVDVIISSDVAHSTFGSMTQAAAGGAFGDGDMAANTGKPVVDYTFPTGTPNFNPASGTAVGPDGQQVAFDVYQAMNVRNQPHQCIFGGTFAVK
jgi:hypothetical protein